MRKKLAKLRNYRHKEIIVLVFIVFIAYLSTLSCSLDDWDSVQFALGLQEFNIAKHQPHPPGYPVYILLGKFFNFFLKNETLALTSLSAVFGALGILFFYFLVFEIYGKKRLAFFSSLLLAVTPLFWLNSLKAMTDIPGLSLGIVSLYLLYRFLKYDKIGFLYGGAFLSGITAGVRLHELFFLLPVLIYVFIKKPRKIGTAIAFFFSGILLWFLPTLIKTGFVSYYLLAKKQFLVRFEGPSLSVLGGDFLNVRYLADKFKEFLKFFLSGSYGILFKKTDYYFPFFLITSLSLAVSFSFSRAKKFAGGLVFFIVGLIPYFLIIFLFLPLSNERYFLPFIPFLSLVITLAFYNFQKIGYALYAIPLALFLLSSVSLSAKIHKEPTPPVQLIQYVQRDYSPENTVLVIVGGMRHLDYYKPDFKMIGRPTSETIEDLLKRNKTVLVIDDNSYYKDFDIKLVKRFSRDPRVHYKHSAAISLYEITGLKSLKK